MNLSILFIFLLVLQGPVCLKELHPYYLPLPKQVSQISHGPNYDYFSTAMLFTISSPMICVPLWLFVGRGIDHASVAIWFIIVINKS